MPAPTLSDWLPSQNFRDDPAAGGALTALIEQVLQPVFDDFWVDAVRFGLQNDPDLADANSVGAMLLDLGCPFPTALTLALPQQRALVKALLGAYKQFGTPVSLINVVRALTGISITKIISPALIHGWELGISVLAEDDDDSFDAAATDLTVLGQSAGNAFSFQIQTATVPTADQQSLIREIIRQIKPAHTHFWGFVSSIAPPSAWELDVSLLGTDSSLGPALLDLSVGGDESLESPADVESSPDP